MSTATSANQPPVTDGSENACVVCFRDVEIYSVGVCDHPVCFECSTRMRVLCGQNECPFCRQDVAKVIFSEDKQPYRQLDVSIRSGLYDKRYRICFANLQVQNAFFKLLDNPCPKCPGRTFVSFDLLKKHVSRDHQLFYCDLCTDNLKIFPFERRCYNRSDLALHNRKGDADDKSHRGHPLCEYCDVRYMDRDELFRHLRREHYFCHFCDADGSNQFYDDYSSLREHFNAKHFVCEEGGCAEEQFTGVFRTEIDLKAHQAKQHSSGMGKMAAKQARTLELEFSLVPRNRAGNGPGGGAAGPSGHQARGGDRDGQAGANGNGGGSSTINIVEGPSRLFNMVPSKRVIDSSNEQEFPSLSGGGSAPGGGGQSSGTSGASSSRQDASIRSKAFKAVGGSGKLNRTNENFPALGGGAAPIPPTSSSVGGNYKKVTASAVLKAKPTASNDEETRPAMKGTVIHISNRPKDFPALKKGARGAAAAAALAEDQSIAATEMMTQLHVNSNSISSKHRGLVDEYSIASAVAQKQGPKIGMVSAAPVATTTTTSSAAKPAKLKLKSEENFPSLSAGAGPSVGPWGGAPKWVAKPPKVESRKSKVAANPLLIINSKKEKNKQKIAADAKARGDGPSSAAGSNNNAFQLTNGGGVALPKKEHTGSKPIAPPGFERKAAKSTAPPPPPGFNVTLNSVSRNNNGAAGLTFTNSSGDKYKIVPTRRYIPPPNTLKRNQELVSIFKQTLKTAEALGEFKTISQMFRENSYSAMPYYDHCRVALGDRFAEIFPELLSLLPDIGKQQELFLVHRQNEGGKKGKSSKMEVCSTCKQVLIPEDLEAHTGEHSSEQNFPTLKK